MSLARELLKSREPELYNALENAWKIAFKEVFPTMYSNDESINSQPHSQNLENYLNSIFEIHPELFENQSGVTISPYELYCILMAILFHDFGRIKFDDGHGSFSKQYVINNFQKFFIPSIELADAIGDICEIHKPLNSINPINTTSILLDAGKGRIRTRELSDLLKLVDEMDTTYRRLKELYILDQPKYFGGKSLFRNYIKGICYDRYAQAIIVSIDNKLIHNTELNPSKWDCIIFKKWKLPYYKFSDSYYKNDLFEFINNGQELKNKIPSKSKVRDKYEKIITDNKISIEQKFNKLLIKIKKILGNKRKHPKDDKEKIINKLIEFDEKENPNEFFRQFSYYFNYYKNEFNALLTDIENAANQRWPFYIVVGLILRAIRDCEKKSINSSYLPRFGIKIKKWLIYYQEHLYDTTGKETIEPIFDTNYLLKVTNNMWNMSTRSWGKIWISFNDLSYKILEKDINRLKLAIQRIDILMRDVAKEQGLPACIAYDNEEWSWVRDGSNLIKVNTVIEKINSIS
jgi:hypothetical protein